MVRVREGFEFKSVKNNVVNGGAAKFILNTRVESHWGYKSLASSETIIQILVR